MAIRHALKGAPTHYHDTVAQAKVCWAQTERAKREVARIVAEDAAREAEGRAEVEAELAVERHLENRGWAEAQAEREWEDARGVVQFDDARRAAEADSEAFNKEWARLKFEAAQLERAQEEAAYRV